MVFLRFCPAAGFYGLSSHELKILNRYCHSRTLQMIQRLIKLNFGNYFK